MIFQVVWHLVGKKNKKNQVVGLMSVNETSLIFKLSEDIFLKKCIHTTQMTLILPFMIVFSYLIRRGKFNLPQQIQNLTKSEKKDTFKIQVLF